LELTIMVAVYMLLVMTKPNPDEVKHLIGVAVSNEEPDESRRAALAKLGELGDPSAVVPLTTMLDGNEGSADLDKEVRAALTKLDALTVLSAKLGSTAPEDKELALELLTYLGDKRALDAVAAELGSKHPKVREKAAAALGRLGDRKTVPLLIKSLADAEADVRMAAAFSLGAIKGPEATRGLERALVTEKDGFVRVALEEGLALARSR
jgi:HEAT repeat protein